MHCGFSMQFFFWLLNCYHRASTTCCMHRARAGVIRQRAMAGVRCSGGTKRKPSCVQMSVTSGSLIRLEKRALSGR